MVIAREITDKALYNASVGYLITANPKNNPYEIVKTNETILDRAYTHEFVHNTRKYRSIAHYILCRKFEIWGLSQEARNYAYRTFTIPYPTLPETEDNEREEAIHQAFADEIKLLPTDIRMLWRDNYVRIICEGIMTLCHQSEEFCEALLDTGNAVICESSAHFMYGTDCHDNSMQLSHPHKWQGENGYGQALMVVRDWLKNNKRRLAL